MIPIGGTSKVTLDPEILSPERAARVGGMLAAIGHPVRLRLLMRMIADPAGEVCVCDLVGLFDLTQPTVSHHLRTLRTAGMLTSRRQGTWIYYGVPEDVRAWVLPIIAGAPGQ